MNITQENQDTAMQRVRNLSINVYLLNSNMQIVNQLSGKVIAGNISIDANSDIRRTCNIDMVMKGAEFDIEEGQIWLDKYVRIETGIENIVTGEIDWINQGVYLISNPVITYSGSESRLSFQGLIFVVIVRVKVEFVFFIVEPFIFCTHTHLNRLSFHHHLTPLSVW